MAARRRPGRWLAPLALVAIAVVIYMIVHSQLHKVHHPSAGRTIPGALVNTRRGVVSGKHHHVTTKTFYVVRSGDTLGAISVKTKIPLATLVSLNPRLDPNALQTGEHIRLRR